ncbi:MAG TPA: PEPxxWA-CTERM sorting domain-containing protein [Phenylobacterium sp.]|jgi:hypothetical protein|nr:PEPxxWA-CTERM sorting domain-containing protein [Phenylobacterium sp.]
MRLFQWAAATLLAAAAAAGAAQADTFSFSNFNTTPGLTLAGNATTTGSPKVLRVVGANFDEAGAAYNTNAFTLGSSDTFSTQFQFQMSGGGGINPADGFTFVVAANPTGLGGEGFGLGYAGVANSVAVEFDTFYNGPGSVANNGGGANNDDIDGANNPSSNHVAIDTNGILTNTDLTDVYGVASCGFTNGTPAESSNQTPGCLSNGDVWTANISYNGSQLTVALFDPAKGAAFVALDSVDIDLASLLGTDQAFVGFTASTGAGFQNTDILNWSFANTTQLAGIPGGAPEPATWGLMITGFGLAGAMLRRRRVAALTT